MSLYNAPMATLEQVKRRMGIRETEIDFDGVLQEILESVSAEIERHARRRLRRAHRIIQTATGGNRLIALRYFPIANIESVRESWDRDFETPGAYEELAYGTDYIFEPDEANDGASGMLRRLNRNWMGNERHPGKVQIIYTGGYKTDDEHRLEHNAITTIQATTDYRISGLRREEDDSGDEHVAPLIDDARLRIEIINFGPTYSGFQQTIFGFESASKIPITSRIRNAEIQFDIRRLDNKAANTGKLSAILINSIDVRSGDPEEIAQTGNPIEAPNDLAAGPITRDFGNGDTRILGGDTSPNGGLNPNGGSFYQQRYEQRRLTLNKLPQWSPDPDGELIKNSLQRMIQKGLFAIKLYSAFRDTSTDSLINWAIRSTRSSGSIPGLNMLGQEEMTKPKIIIEHSPGFHDIYTMPDDLRNACLIQTVHEFQQRRNPGRTEYSMRGVSIASGAFEKHGAMDLLPAVQRIAQSYRRINTGSAAVLGGF